jgi:hypothetical protein
MSKSLTLVIMTAAGFFLLGLITCKHLSPGKTVPGYADTTINITVPPHAPIPEISIPQLARVDSFIKYEVIPVAGDTVYVHRVIYDKLAEHYAINVYRDTIWIPDTSVVSGYVSMIDTVSENKIMRRSVDMSFKFPPIPKPVVSHKFYAGGSVTWTPVVSTFMAEGSWLNKNCFMTDAGIGVSTMGKGAIKLGFKTQL